MAMTSAEYFQWGARKRRRAWEKSHQAEEVMENKSAIRLDRRIVGADKEALPCNNSSSHCLALSPEISSRLQTRVNNIVCTRSSNHTKRRKTMLDNGALNLLSFVWPNLCLSLSRSEKEEDFLAMKGSKLPLRPKKRLKSIQRAIDDVIPGGCLGDISKERYEVKEKKCRKKGPRGLKAMARLESDSE